MIHDLRPMLWRDLGGQTDSLIAVGIIPSHGRAGSWLANQADIQQRNEPTSYGERASGNVAATYDSAVQQQLSRGRAGRATRRNMLVRSGYEKPLRLPSHPWLAFDEEECPAGTVMRSLRWHRRRGTPDSTRRPSAKLTAPRHDGCLEAAKVATMEGRGGMVGAPGATGWGGKWVMGKVA
jgi:hypothetical protein